MSETGRSKTGTPAGASTISAAVTPKPEVNGSQRQSPDQTEETPRTQDGSEYPSVAGIQLMRNLHLTWYQGIFMLRTVGLHLESRHVYVNRNVIMSVNF